MVELKIPRENANDDFVLITKVHTKDGEKVNVGDILFEFETSKPPLSLKPITMDIYELQIGEGTQIPVDSVVGVISDSKNIESRHGPNFSIYHFGY